MSKMQQKVEIMAPAGSFESLAAALRAGADSVYFGVGELNMRARATVNFTEADLPKVARLCHACGARAYLTCNVVVYDEELAPMRKLLDHAKAAGVDAVIAADAAVIAYAHSIGLEVHISVQANVCNLDAVRFYARYADVMVLARELKLSQIRAIIDGIASEGICGPSGQLVRVELFAHGALCIGISGRCGMSLAAHNHSANRGDCFQLCRRRYVVTDAETGTEMALDNQYIMSPKDICTIRVLDQLLAAGVAVLKLEGRGRSESYVSTVTAVYKEAAQACAEGSWSEPKVQAWEQRLQSVYHRQFWHGGYYLGEPWEMWSGRPDTRALEQRQHLGRVVRWYPRARVAELRLEAAPLSPGEVVEITGPTTGVVRLTVPAVHCDDAEGVTREVPQAPKGSIALVAMEQKVRRGDKVYTIRRRQLS